VSDYEHIITAGILQRPSRISDVSSIKHEYFSDKEARALFAMVQTYHEKCGRRNAMDIALARSRLEDSKSKLAPHLLYLVDEYTELDPVTDSEFRDAIEKLVTSRREGLLREHGAAALEAMVEGEYSEATARMREALLAADDTDLEDDRPVDIRSSVEIDRERRRTERPPEDGTLGFDIGFPRLMRATRFRRKELTILGGYASDGKALSHGTPVLTPSGWRDVEDVRVGELVTGRDGSPTRVVGVFPQGRRDLLRVTFADGCWVDVDQDHLWAVQDVNDARRPGLVTRTKTTRELVPDLRLKNGSAKWRVPLCGSVEFEPGPPLLIDPYLLGVLLGDGCLSQTSVTFCTGDEDVPCEVEKVLPRGVVMRKNGTDEASGRAVRYSLVTEGRRQNPARDALEALEVMGKRAWEKTVPEVYLFASPEDRLSLLQGLVDTDSDVASRGKPSFVFTSSSENLTRSVAFLVRSLGGVARERSRIPTYCHLGEKKQGRRSYEVCANLPVHLIPTRAHRTKWPTRLSRNLVRKITAIEPVGEAEATCLAVEAEDHLFIVKDFVVTHNTQFSKSLAYNVNRAGATVIFVALEMTREEIRTMFVAQHAASLDPRGVPWVDALDGILNAGQRKLWHRALDDWQIDSHEDTDEMTSESGSLIIWAPTRRITQADWKARLRASKQEHGIDVAFKDYTELVKP